MGKKNKKNSLSTKNLFIIATISAFALVLPVAWAYYSKADSNLEEAQASTLFSDNFESYSLGNWTEGSTQGPWKVQFTGYGTAGVEMDQTNKVHYQKPLASTAVSETHASLTTTQQSYGDFDMTLKAATVQQLRTPTPNAWETAWVMWHYTDNTHFYYLALKTNGWELGKGDPAYPGAQRFLATGSNPAFTIGTWYNVRVKQQNNAMTVWVNDQLLTTFVDNENPYLTGSMGLYNEDAYVYFDDIIVNDLSGATATPSVTLGPSTIPSPTLAADVTPPNVSITSPSNGATFARGSGITIAASASDNVNVQRVEFYVNNSLKCTDTTASYSCYWKLPSKKATYTIKAIARDTAGNAKTSSQITIYAR